METNTQLQLAHDFVEHTSANIFLTGKAGTGKTTFLKNIRNITSKRLIVVAPTGVAAINAAGETMHSFFQIPFAPYIPGVKNAQIRRFNKTKIAIMRSLDLLVIDEISMVRADVLDSIDSVLRRFRDRDKPFGGVQLLMIGDLRQLSPVVKPEEWELLQEHYPTPYFFDSHSLKQTFYTCIELNHVFRQRDNHFIELLEKVRTANLESEDIDLLNSRYIKNFKPEKGQNFITLTSHNNTAKEINETKLSKISHKQYSFDADIQDDFPEYLYPVDARLRLKLGAQVMFTKNDNSPQKRFVNGTIGTIIDISDDRIEVKPSDNHPSVVVERMQWENCHYSIDDKTKEITETLVGTFTQYPLKTAWAITIHKSQGLTFDYTMIDASDAFSHGQVYVALSRCRTLEGIVLLRKLSYSAIISDYKVSNFMTAFERNPVGREQLELQKDYYFKQILREVYDYQKVKENVSSLFYLITGKLKGSYPKLAFRWVDEYHKFNKEIFEVGDKFFAQLLNILQNNFQETSLLHERMSKASEYFTDKLKNELCPLIKASYIKVEAKETKKTLDRLLENIDELLRIKLAVLAIEAKDFSTSTYLKAKAVALLEKEKSEGNKPEILTQKSSKLPLPKGDIENPELFEHLRAWRKNKCDELGVAAFKIATQKALIGISNYMPQSTKEFLNIKGIGPVFVARFAREVLKIIDEYLEGKI
ncbi:MAG: AAA family ATPase [Rikenellaceae bacterium]